MRLTLCAALFLLTAAITITTQAYAESALPEGGPTEKSRFENARGIYMLGSYEPAVAELRNIARDFPKGEYADDAYYWLGMYAMMTGNYDEALGHFTRVTSQMSNSDMAAAAQLEAAYCYSEPANPKHDYDKAIAEFMKLPFFYPDSTLIDDAAYHAALCQMKTGRYVQAGEDLRAFANRYPGSEYAAPALYQLGMTFIMQGKTDDALNAFQSVRDNHPAGLYRQRALDKIELVVHTRDRRAPKLSSTYGSKGSAPGTFNKPSGAGLDEDGRLYVADSGNSRVQRLTYTSSGLALDVPVFGPPSPDKEQKMSQPVGVAAGPKGLIYVADASANRVQVLGPDGSLVLSFGRRGKEAGEFDGPCGVVVDEGGNIYVADRGNRRVSRFDPKGRPLGVVGVFGTREEDRMGAPSGLALDLEGNLLVTDNKKDRLYKFDPAGKLVTVVGGEDGRGNKRLDDPAGVGVDGIGNVYVASQGSKSIVVLDRGLNQLAVTEGDGDALDKPTGLAVSEAGVVFVTDAGQGKVVVFK